MELGIDRTGWRQDTAHGQPGAAQGTPEWHALLARFGAAYSARHEMEEDRTADADTAGGSFDRGCARIVGGYGQGASQSLSHVNPSALVHGKPEAAILGSIAGSHMAGDRG
jgi:hypothetical protein